MMFVTLNIDINKVSFIKGKKNKQTKKAQDLIFIEPVAKRKIYPHCEYKISQCGMSSL